MLKNMFKKTYINLESVHAEKNKRNISNQLEGKWRQCKKCSSAIFAEDVKKNLYICPKCGTYFRVHANRRIEMLVDDGSFEEWNSHMEFSNPLDFPGYEEKVLQAKAKTKLDEAVITGKALIDNTPFVICVCDARFMMSSMGHNVGEKITYAIEKAAILELPVVIFACSGGARMQEGIVSLMQMAKTSAALKKLHKAGQVFISVLTDPTTGGVTASFAMLGDIIIAEPKALIGFAGPRVIAQTIGTRLPDGFQRSEFLLEHGFVDLIIERKNQKEEISKLLKIHSKNKSKSYIKDVVSDNNQDNSDKDTCGNENNRKKDGSENYFSDVLKDDESITAWEKVLKSRDKDRLTSFDYISAIFPDFIELHGDRLLADDGAIIGGLATINGQAVTVIGQQKGRSIKENKIRNFGMPSPEGYRKALRLMKEAETFNRPVICFVDTPGAFCGIEAEERGQGEAIARNLFEMSDLKVPVLSVVIGEGGSGGALAMAVANEVWMLENAIYSILSPEGFAAILYKDAKKCKEAAENMKITAKELKNLQIIEKIIPEKVPATVENIELISNLLAEEITEFLNKYLKMSSQELIEQRYERYRKF